MNKKILIYLIMPLLLAATFVFSLVFGSSDISFIDVFAALFSGGDSDNALIVKTLRLPRIALAMVAGAGLAASGAVFQGILRNPLADPFTLGISGGASFGAAIAFVLGLSAHLFLLPIFSFLGAMTAAALVYTISRQKRFDSNSMILAGVVISYVFSSAVMLLFSLSSANRMQAAFVWLMGNFSMFEDGIIWLVFIVVIVGTLLLCLSANTINILSLGGDKSKSFGVNTQRSVQIIFLIASFISASIVCACGIIGFVGLMIPHIMRKFVGANHIFLIPACAFAGAVFLPISDTIGRTLFSPIMLPVGIITNIAGGLFFVVLLLRGKQNGNA
jgi:iron complex transport system permease protein